MENEAIECRVERLEKDVQILYERTNETKIWQGIFGVKIDNIEKSLVAMTADIKSLLEKPQKRWDAVVASAISAVVGGVIGVMLASVFGGIL